MSSPFWIVLYILILLIFWEPLISSVHSHKISTSLPTYLAQTTYTRRRHQHLSLETRKRAPFCPSCLANKLHRCARASPYLNLLLYWSTYQNQTPYLHQEVHVQFHQRSCGVDFFPEGWICVAQEEDTAIGPVVKIFSSSCIEYFIMHALLFYCRLVCFFLHSVRSFPQAGNFFGEINQEL